MGCKLPGVSQCISLSSGGIMAERDVSQADPVWGMDTEVFATTRGTSPASKSTQKHVLGLANVFKENDFASGSYFPSKTSSSTPNAGPRHWVIYWFPKTLAWPRMAIVLVCALLPLPGHHMLSDSPGPCPPCPPSAGFQPGPASEGWHTATPSSSSPTGFWRRGPLLLKLHIQKWVKPFTFSICLWNWSLCPAPLQEADGTSCYCK